MDEVLPCGVARLKSSEAFTDQVDVLVRNTRSPALGGHLDADQPVDRGAL
jgi:hypothetical protein